ncbi:MAG: hypothetical protein KatS3mg110_1761 [Pirellulaceae bacterium]|nr:MAG: hypothetical protein KatS3mg110_1761 [Pirellulaceae bacterium]
MQGEKFLTEWFHVAGKRRGPVNEGNEKSDRKGPLLGCVLCRAAINKEQVCELLKMNGKLEMWGYGWSEQNLYAVEWRTVEEWIDVLERCDVWSVFDQQMQVIVRNKMGKRGVCVAAEMAADEYEKTVGGTEWDSYKYQCVVQGRRYVLAGIAGEDTVSQGGGSDTPVKRRHGVDNGVLMEIRVNEYYSLCHVGRWTRYCEVLKKIALSGEEGIR